MLHDSAGVVFHYSVFLVKPLKWILGKENELSQIPMSRTTSPIGVRTSKLNRLLTGSKMIFSWMVELDGYTKAQ
jgi:hypothetical protein